MPNAELHAQMLRSWLLGKLSEAEAEALEAELIEREPMFDELRAIESELWDDLAAGRLDASEREAFLRTRTSPEDRERLRFAQALDRRAMDRSLLRSSRFRRSFLAAAATVVLALSALLLLNRAGSPAAVDTVAESAPKTETAPAVPTRTETAPASVAALRSVELTVILGTMRSESGASGVEIPPDAATVRLRVEIHPDDVYSSYRVALHPVAGGAAIEREGLRASGSALRVEIPAAALSAGMWELSVTGVEDGQAEDLGFETIEVQRPAVDTR